MKHLIDLFLDIVDGFERMLFIIQRKKHNPSLIVDNVLWCTNSTWMERLIAYKQLSLWTYDR